MKKSEEVREIRVEGLIPSPMPTNEKFVKRYHLEINCISIAELNQTTICPLLQYISLFQLWLSIMILPNQIFFTTRK